MSVDTGSSIEKEPQVEASFRSKAIAVGFVALSLATGFGGAKLGYESVQHEELAANANDLAAVRRHESCISIVNRKTPPGSRFAVVKLADLTPSEQRDCEVDTIARNEKKYSPRTGTGISLPLDSKITEVQLPSEVSLRQAAQKAQQASEVNVYSEVGKYPLGATVGFMGLLVPALIAETAIRLNSRIKSRSTA